MTLLKYLKRGVLMTSIVFGSFLLNCEKEKKCFINSDCPEDHLCLGYQCVESKNIPEKGAQKVLEGFVNTLKENNLEEAVSYFYPSVQGEYKKILSQENLSELAEQLEGSYLSNCSGKRIMECSLYVDGKEERIQLMLWEDGPSVYKIRNF